MLLADLLQILPGLLICASVHQIKSKAKQAKKLSYVTLRWTLDINLKVPVLFEQ